MNRLTNILARTHEFLNQNSDDVYHVSMAIILVVAMTPLGLGGSALGLAAWTIARMAAHV